MKHIFATTLIAMGAATALPATAGDVGISINIGQPGFFGQIDLGAVPAPPPALIYARPVVIERPVYAAAPIYLRVPPGYERHWAHHCAEYNACGRPVYFVRDDWYRHEFAPRYQERYEHSRPEDRGDWHSDHDHGRDHDHDHGEYHGRDDHDR